MMMSMKVEEEWKELFLEGWSLKPCGSLLPYKLAIPVNIISVRWAFCFILTAKNNIGSLIRRLRILLLRSLFLEKNQHSYDPHQYCCLLLIILHGKLLHDNNIFFSGKGLQNGWDNSFQHQHGEQRNAW